MITVLAEKRPQAVIMAGVLGADRDRGGWFEGNGYCVTWCRGHLVRISTPLSASEWTGENLPIIPDKFVLEPVSKDAFGNEPDPEVLERLKVIRGLFSRSESLVNACDAGREGEGIFRNVYEYLECDKPFRRLWADSLTEGALRRAFEDLRPSSDYDLLARAARAREEADWLIGVNATRAATATADADRVLSAGRVQTAVLKMICDRFDEFNAFEAKPFWTIRGEFIKDGEDVRWRSSDRFVVEETANAVMEAVRETWELTVVSVDVERKTSHAPLLHNLGSLQKEANVRLGMSAADCEKTVQSLYEKQLVSYPRTESRYLSQDEFDAVPEIVQGLENDPTYGRVARALSRRGLSTRCLDDRKMKEHPPLMVTDKKPWKLSAPERDVYNLILMRFLEAFCPSSVSDVTTVILEGAGREFVTRASVPVADGWKCVAKADRKPDLGPAEGVEEDPDGNPVEIRSSFPTLKEGDAVKVSKMELVKDETHPRPLLTDATLLSMMESAGKGGAGIGTAATRGAEIDILVDRGYAKRIMESRSLVPTQLGRDFYDAVRDMEICSVEMTSKWEASLESIKEGVCPDGLFGEQVRNYTKKMTGEILAGKLRCRGTGKPRQC